MLHITGLENIVLPHVKEMVISNIMPLGAPDAEQPYQRELMFVTDEGILHVTLIATERDTLCFAADPQVQTGALPFETAGEEHK